MTHIKTVSSSFSGTTGLSKGVKLSHKNIISNSMMINSDTGNGQLTYPAIGTHQDSLPCVLPFFHIYGLTCTLLSKLAHGCKLVTLPRFSPDTYLDVLEKHNSSVLYLVPPISEFVTILLYCFILFTQLDFVTSCFSHLHEQL